MNFYKFSISKIFSRKSSPPSLKMNFNLFLYFDQKTITHTFKHVLHMEDVFHIKKIFGDIITK